MVKDRLFMDDIGKRGWKNVWHVFKCCSDICLEGLRNFMKSLKKAGFWELQNTSNLSCEPRRLPYVEEVVQVFYWIW